VDTGGQFNTFDDSSYLGNINLCGSPLSKTCRSKSSLLNRTIGSSDLKGSSTKKRSLIIATTIVSAIIVVGFAIGWMRPCAGNRNRSAPNLEMCYFEEPFLKVSEKDIYRITEGYSERNIIGSGASSTVYKGQLVNGMTVAIKKFKVELEAEAQRCFMTECKTLGKIRHRNLVKIMGVVSNLDVKILILQFMPNGSLDMHLHGNSTRLDWATRLRIAMGVAQALVYLHEECGIGEIVHCDIKPSNILLDEEFEAHINDFGIARLIDPQLRGSTLSTTLRGSIGYIAPGNASTFIIVINQIVASFVCNFN
jgi:tRNA A-37 threonylcarbamoyl transferase component Bud32